MIGMESIVQQANNFCPAPWNAMFYQVDKASVCCVSEDKLKMTPDEFRKSQYLKQLKQDLLDGKKPSNCNNCWKTEEKNHQSIRQHFLTNFPGYNFTDTEDYPLEYMELRCSNLCNFMCRMCNPTNSIEIAREAKKFPFIHKFHDKGEYELSEISEENYSQISRSTKDLKYLFLTGGEPFLMKQYYDLLDSMIDNGKCDDTVLQIYTNCSVYNPKFVDKIKRFKSVKLNMSIDAVGKVAEYQRKGTIWDTVKSNAVKLAEIENIQPFIHSTVTAYTVLDMSALIDFYIEMQDKFPNIKFMMHTASHPLGMSYTCLDERTRKFAAAQIGDAIKKIETRSKMGRIKEELRHMSQGLAFTPIKDFDKLCNLTKYFDAMRDESFEDVFGYKLF